MFYISLKNIELNFAPHFSLQIIRFTHFFDMRVLYILTVAILPFANAVGTFSYKPDSEYAPNAWPGIFLGDDIENQCGGAKQSGIDIPTHPCDVFDDYIFEVSAQERRTVHGKGCIAAPFYCNVTHPGLHRHCCLSSI